MSHKLKEVKLSPEKLKERLMGSALRMTEPNEESNLAVIYYSLSIINVSIKHHSLYIMIYFLYIILIYC